MLRLGNSLDIRRIHNLLEEYGIDDKIKDLTAQLEIDAGTDILPDETRSAINDLMKSELNTFDSDKFFDNVSVISQLRRPIDLINEI